MWRQYGQAGTGSDSVTTLTQREYTHCAKETEGKGKKVTHSLKDWLFQT